MVSWYLRCVVFVSNSTILHILTIEIIIKLMPVWGKKTRKVNICDSEIETRINTNDHCFSRKNVENPKLRHKGGDVSRHQNLRDFQTLVQCRPCGTLSEPSNRVLKAPFYISLKDNSSKKGNKWWIYLAFFINIVSSFI
jgi:hypothetical protein